MPSPLQVRRGRQTTDPRPWLQGCRLNRRPLSLPESLGAAPLLGHGGRERCVFAPRGAAVGIFLAETGFPRSLRERPPQDLELGENLP